jgi:hypothetical protein
MLLTGEAGLNSFNCIICIIFEMHFFDEFFHWHTDY